MGTIYSPLLLLTAYLEAKEAKLVRWNQRHGEQDDDTTEEWEQMSGEVDFEAEGWTKIVEGSRPNVETDAAVLEIRELKARVEDLRKVVVELVRERDGLGGD